MTEHLVNLIGSLGFPIAVTVYLLVERGKTMKELTRAINELSMIIKARLK